MTNNAKICHDTSDSEKSVPKNGQVQLRAHARALALAASASAPETIGSVNYPLKLKLIQVPFGKFNGNPIESARTLLGSPSPPSMGEGLLRTALSSRHVTVYKVGTTSTLEFST
jgi:hypothetical protein